MTEATMDVAPEREVAVDLAKRGLYAAPVLLGVGALGWGLDGLASAGLALGLVVANFLAGAWLIGWSARISPQTMMAAVLGGFVLRLAVITVVVLAVRDMGWFDVVPFALVLIVSHLGLLAWETRHVSATLAYPGLKPSRGQRTVTDKE